MVGGRRPARPSAGAAERTKQLDCRIAADPRLPLPGTTLTRPYKGRLVEVRVLADGFVYEGEHFKSLSAVVKAVTGKHWNGYHFFGLRSSGGAA